MFVICYCGVLKNLFWFPCFFHNNYYFPIGCDVVLVRIMASARLVMATLTHSEGFCSLFRILCSIIRPQKLSTYDLFSIIIIDTEKQS